MLHTGEPPLHVALDTQATQVPPATSQTGVAPVHFAVFVAEHAPHAPVGSHAGVVPPHSTSPAHARQVCVAALHTGFVPVQSAFATQATQLPEAALQTGVVPPHLATFVAEH